MNKNGTSSSFNLLVMVIVALLVIFMLTELFSRTSIDRCNEESQVMISLLASKIQVADSGIEQIMKIKFNYCQERNIESFKIKTSDNINICERLLHCDYPYSCKYIEFYYKTEDQAFKNVKCINIPSYTKLIPDCERSWSKLGGSDPEGIIAVDLFEKIEENTYFIQATDATKICTFKFEEEIK